MVDRISRWVNGVWAVLTRHVVADGALNPRLRPNRQHKLHHLEPGGEHPQPAGGVGGVAGAVYGALSR